MIFSSFFPPNLMQVRRLLPEVPRGQLAISGRAGWWQRAWGRLIDVQADHPYTSDVTRDSVVNSRQRGRLVHVYTVNDPADMQRLCDLGVDGLITDDPLLAIKNNFR